MTGPTIRFPGYPHAFTQCLVWLIREHGVDGEVANAVELIEKLAASERAEQVFVRHAFRFWMGRNENLNDAPVLQEAHRAYRDSGGSMRALIVSLLTSDAFLYRTRRNASLNEAG